MKLNVNQRRVIEVLYMEMYYLLSSYAQSALSDRSLAEEVVHDAFLVACTNVEKLLFSPNPKGWLLVTLKNVINNTVRRRTYFNSIIQFSLDIDKYMFGYTDAPNVDLLYSDMANNSDFKLLKKIVLDKYSMLEVAQELGISEEACKKRFQRAKKKLKQHFQRIFT